MSDGSTTNYHFTKPEVGASASTWGTKLNANFDSIDTNLKTVADVAEREASTTVMGQVELATSAEVAAGSEALLVVTTQALGELFRGSIVDFAMTSPPSGWLECDGSAVSRSTYSALFAKIGTTWGAGDNSTTFNLPDFRGEFRRSWDHGKGTDAGRAFASHQDGAIEGHTHDIAMTANTGAGKVLRGDGTLSDTYQTGSTGGSETRPRNFAVMTCIRY